MSIFDNKRIYDRISDTFNVKMFSFNHQTKKAAREFNDATSINVSGSGLLVKINEEIEPGSTVMVTFLKPNSFDFFRGYGRVVRLERSLDNDYNVALSFIDQSLEECRELDYYIKMRRRK